MTLWARRLIGRVGRLVYPGYGACRHCGRPWPICRSHMVPLTPVESFFPLCEECWDETTIYEHVRYARDLWDSWQREGDTEPWEPFKRAVMRHDNANLLERLTRTGRWAR